MMLTETFFFFFILHLKSNGRKGLQKKRIATNVWYACIFISNEIRISFWFTHLYSPHKFFCSFFGSHRRLYSNLVCVFCMCVSACVCVFQSERVHSKNVNSMFLRWNEVFFLGKMFHSHAMNFVASNAEWIA